MFYHKYIQVLCDQDKKEACIVKRGPAAVTGDEHHDKPLSAYVTGWEGVISRSIREPEDLPVYQGNDSG